LPADFSGRNSCADIHVAASGRFVYSSNRGHDSIAVFAVDEASGTLTLLGHVSTGGETPRNFALDPSGDFLLAANQRTDTIVSFRIDQETGMLTPTGHVAAVPTPVCILFAEG
jgi:6-phosphogluconolactonase